MHKKTTLILLLFLSIIACKKTETGNLPPTTGLKSYDDLTYGDIKKVSDSEYSNQSLTIAKLASANNLGPGSILFFKTTQGNYGKLIILEVENSANSAGIAVHFLYSYTYLDTENKLKSISGPDYLEAGFWFSLYWWEYFFEPNPDADFKLLPGGTSDQLRLEPQNNAVFYVYFKA
jgi:hypothetical protein